MIPAAHCYLDSLQRMISGCIPDTNLKGINLVTLDASTDDNQIVLKINFFKSFQNRYLGSNDL